MTDAAAICHIASSSSFCNSTCSLCRRCRLRCCCLARAFGACSSSEPVTTPSAGCTRRFNCGGCAAAAAAVAGAASRSSDLPAAAGCSWRACRSAAATWRQMRCQMALHVASTGPADSRPAASPLAVARYRPRDSRAAMYKPFQAARKPVGAAFVLRAAAGASRAGRSSGRPRQSGLRMTGGAASASAVAKCTAKTVS